ncbi:MAG: NAD(P)/FAD-dependent oxidoreductase [Saprospiraceae bacterium]|nr:NAD(P)/FAD-dependent oxidoreductase [Saprospiraceae bacterium]
MNDRDQPQKWKVIIVGAGPAGIATGLTLNSLGISNCIIESHTSPPFKFGEALPPNAKPILHQLGIEKLIRDPRHLNYFGNKSCWGNENWEQKEFITSIHGHGYLLDRFYFEKQLWETYVKTGGNLLYGSRFQQVEQVNTLHKVSIRSTREEVDIFSDMMVDATGRKALVARMLGAEKYNLDSQFGFSFTIPVEIPLAKQVCIESVETGWWYVSPVRENELSVMFFTTKEMIPPNHQFTSFLLTQFNKTLHLKKIIQIDEVRHAIVRIKPSGTSRLNCPYGTNWLAVGDAAINYDPISSFGITSALASGYYAGQAISSHFEGRKEAFYAYRYVLENGFMAYLKKLQFQYNSEKRWEHNDYWKVRQQEIRSIFENNEV